MLAHSRIIMPALPTADYTGHAEARGRVLGPASQGAGCPEPSKGKGTRGLCPISLLRTQVPQGVDGETGPPGGTVFSGGGMGGKPGPSSGKAHHGAGVGLPIRQGLCMACGSGHWVLVPRSL